MSQYKTLKRLSFSVFGLPTAAAGGAKAVQALLLCNRHEVATHVHEAQLQIKVSLFVTCIYVCYCQ